MYNNRNNQHWGLGTTKLPLCFIKWKSSSAGIEKLSVNA